MIRTPLLWLCFLCLLCAGPLLRADNIPDPDIQVDDPTCPESGCTNVTAGTFFTFSSNATGGGTTFFQLSTSSAGFSTLDIETAGIFGSTTDVKCFTNVFGSCTVKFLGGVTDIYLSGCIEGPCISPGGIFDINLDTIAFDTAGNPLPPGCATSIGGCPGITPGVGDWGANRSFTAIGGNFADVTTPFISAPEPSSFFLLCSGAAAVALRRKMVKR